MRHNYVGDIGDYAKYGILRKMCTKNNLKLGVIWYLYEDPCNPNDGLHLDYLEKEELYKAFDPDLHSKLKQLIKDNDRHISAIRKRQLLPAGTEYFEKPLALSHLPKMSKRAIQDRITYRKGWFDEALEKTKDADIIFLDPDNGFEVASTKIHQDRSPKFAYYDEIKQLWARGQSLVIYQHKNMHQSTEIQINSRKQELCQHLNIKPENIVTLYVSSHGGRMFFVVSKNQKILDSAKGINYNFIKIH